MTKPPLGLTPRNFWLKERTSNCISVLQRLEDIEDWELYRRQALNLAEELLYAVTEWEKYYK